MTPALSPPFRRRRPDGPQLRLRNGRQRLLSPRPGRGRREAAGAAAEEEDQREEEGEEEQRGEEGGRLCGRGGEEDQKKGFRPFKVGVLKYLEPSSRSHVTSLNSICGSNRGYPQHPSQVPNAVGYEGWETTALLPPG